MVVVAEGGAGRGIIIVCSIDLCERQDPCCCCRGKSKITKAVLKYKRRPLFAGIPRFQGYLTFFQTPVESEGET